MKAKRSHARAPGKVQFSIALDRTLLDAVGAMAEKERRQGKGQRSKRAQGREAAQGQSKGGMKMNLLESVKLMGIAGFAVVDVRLHEGPTLGSLELVAKITPGFDKPASKSATKTMKRQQKRAKRVTLPR